MNAEKFDKAINNAERADKTPASETQEIERLQQLRLQLIAANHAYYRLGHSPMSDGDFDFQLQELTTLEEKYPAYLDPNSPTQKVGDDKSHGFRKVTHKYPMLSIQNTYSMEEVAHFHGQVIDKIPEAEVEYVVELKIDGVAMSLIYENRKLMQAVTRGDGVMGDEVTENIKTIATVPHKLPSSFPAERFEVRGEIYMTRENFEHYNAYSQLHYGKEMQNPRNTASGSLKLKDPAEAAQRKLDFFAYAILNDETQGSHWENLEHLATAFPVNTHRAKAKTVEAIMAICDSLQKIRDDLPYNIDGAVIKVNGIGQQIILGRTSKSPKWVIAYKYKAEAAESILESVSFQVGRTGSVTPVANLKPVSLGGTLVKRATLHNFEEIERLGLKLHDHVWVEKGGEIIPKITAVIIEKRPTHAENIALPTHCPVCQGELVKVPEEVVLRCENLQCPAQVQRAILHFVSRGAMNIENIGPALVDTLLAKGLIKNVADLYQLKAEDLSDLDRMAEKSAQNVMSSLAQSKNNSLERLIFGLGIRHIGKTSSTLLAKKFKTLQAISEATQEQLEAVSEIGGRMAESLLNFFKDMQNQHLLKQLAELGVNTEYLSTQESQVLEGLTFVITGTLPTWSREEAKAQIEKAGGKITDAVSKKTSYLLAGEAAGSKLDKAQKLSIRILNEVELKQILMQDSALNIE